MHDDLSREVIERNLIDIGFHHQQVDCLLEYYDDGDNNNIYQHLRKQRSQLLEDVHHRGVRTNSWTRNDGEE
ncbi:hypothetical protein FYJ79_10105 [Sharpea azabuensis]|uniref:Uncharacterized protein n=1 Tax=Sharpea porci TaxID=2652286 RepID=A0A844FV70_9FIRM|nr:hypothetical protein [Sharpea porci]MST89918.1 hypothetical protein [Sharpea porci]